MSRSNSTIIRFRKEENLRGLVLSFARAFGSYRCLSAEVIKWGDGYTHLEQSTFDFECPRGYSLPRLKVDRLSTLRRCRGFAILPQLP